MDPYAPCPCGSGKKVKFCCQAILPEMAKIERLQENNQPRMALQAIDKLRKSHPENPWLVTQRAMALLAEDRNAEARDTLVPFLRKNPDHPLANGLLAMAMIGLEPYPASKKVIHRAFLKASAAEPALMTALVGHVTSYHIEQENVMAARQHMSLLLQYQDEQERSRTLSALIDLDSDSTVPYLLRGAHLFPAFEPSGELLSVYRKAVKIASMGCFEEAAGLLEQATKDHGERPELYHAIGLFRAWDGDEPQAAAALHQAAERYRETDWELAVELESIAQLLDARSPENIARSVSRVYEVQSLSRLLTRLDNEDRLGRLPREPEEGRGQDYPVALYDVLDRRAPTAAELPEMTLETAPVIVGHVALFDSTEAGPAGAILEGVEGAPFDSALETFTSAAGELVVLASPQPKTSAYFNLQYAKDELPLSQSLYFPPKTPNAVHQRISSDFVRKCIDETWLNTPRPALGGASPAEAAQNPALQLPLAAALRVFDSFLDRRGIMLDQQPLRERLGLPSPEPIRLGEGEEFDLKRMSVADLQRIDLSALSDEQFQRVLHRSVLAKHSGLMYRVLREFVENRPKLTEQQPQDAMQAFNSLAGICSDNFRFEEGLQWLERGFQFVRGRDGSFEAELIWKFRELGYRARDPNSPQLKNLLLELWNHYGAKLPIIRERLQQFVDSYELEAPWDSAIVTAQTVSSEGGTLWTAETEQTVSTEKKLWLPE